MVVGSLRRPADALVPIVAALAGVATPALVYLAVNLLDDGRPSGWAIPAATDIAFALAVLAVVGSSLPSALRAFLLTLAVVDDLVVIVIIAVFYTSTLHLLPLLAAALLLAAYAVLQRLRVTSALVYVPLVVATWWAVHESGVHATVAGVALGLLTRVRPDPDENRSPAERLEHRLTPSPRGSRCRSSPCSAPASRSTSTAGSSPTRWSSAWCWAWWSASPSGSSAAPGW